MKKGQKKKTEEGILSIVQKEAVGSKDITPIKTTPGKVTLIEKTIKTTPASKPLPNGIEINNLSVHLTEQKIAEENLPVFSVFEFTYYINKVEKVVYTKTVPILNHNMINISNGFGRSDLKEIVLGKKEVKTSCNNPLETPDLSIDMRTGVMIKVIPEQPWMGRDYITTKKEFDETVLRAYREMSTSVTLKDQGKVIVPRAKTTGITPKTPSDIQFVDDDNDYPIGNIPVNNRR